MDGGCCAVTSILKKSGFKSRGLNLQLGCVDCGEKSGTSDDKWY